VKIYDIAFYSAIFFIFGVFLSNSEMDFLAAVFASAFLASFFSLAGFIGVFKAVRQSEFFWLAGLSFLAVAGFAYCDFRDFAFESGSRMEFEKKTHFEAAVSDFPKRGEYQDLVLSLLPPYAGKISARIKNLPRFDYGDILSVSGKIEKISPDGYGKYLEKEGISGTIGFPNIEFLEKGGGSRFKKALFSLKEKALSVFEKNLPAMEANLLAGLVLGERAGFEKDFEEKMKNSGTTHLVALSGYNISVLVLAVAAVLGGFLKRKNSFFATVAAIFAFTVMTGAEASVVRAAIMGGILVIAGESGRVFSVRNAIALAALAMVLFNPKVLNFDLGFQLSFAALFGIVCLSPALKGLFKAKPEPGILNWRENFWATVSAQAAAFPILISKFGSFPLLSVISNVLILGFVPVTMFLGFVLAISGIFFPWLAPIMALPAEAFLRYEIWVINFFGTKNGLFVSSVPVFFIFAYCAFLVIFAVYAWRAKRIKLEYGGQK
jgi:competence protein ComEC